MQTGALLSVALYLFILAGNIVSNALQKKRLAGLFKVLLMPSLALFYYTAFPHMVLAVVLALAFSWAGDIFLLQSKFAFLLAGIASFALAHIFYIIHMMTGLMLALPNMLTLLIVAVIYLFISTGINVYLKDKVRPILGNASGAVSIYAGLLASLCICAVVFGIEMASPAGWLLILGANLFLISDSILSLDLFVKKHAYNDVIIMASYGLAQLCIVWGFGLL